MFAKLDNFIVRSMQRWGMPVLRISLALVFLWFGLLKILEASPATELIRSVYPFIPDRFPFYLGIWEVVVGIGLMFKITLRLTFGLLWLQMLGTLVAPFAAPSVFFLVSNPLFLTLEGEFVVKNLVLVASSIVVAGSMVKPVPNKGATSL